MSVLIRDLLAATQLSISALTTHCETTDIEISWVATTELPDPAPFFRGGELVCTTALQERSDIEWRRHIDRLLEVPIAGLCIGTGLIRDEVPQVVIDMAEEAGLPLMNSPVGVPFIQISRWVADRLFADRYQMVQRMASAQDELLASMLANRSLPWLVRLLARRMGHDTQIAIIDVNSRPITQAPEDGTLGEQLRAEPQDETIETEVPIVVGGETIAFLRCRSASPLMPMVSYAANILGLEIARRNAILSGQRMLASQVLEDVVEQSVTGSEASRRLRSLGFDPTSPHAVVVGQSQRPSEALTAHPASILGLFQPQDEAHVTAILGAEVVILATADAAGDVGRRLLERLRDQDQQATVGIGSAHTGARGVRASYFEARQALTLGPGLHESDDLPLSTVLIGSVDQGVRELAAGVLQPLIDHDEKHNSSLLLTLRTYLGHDGSSSATCRVLHLHRNSLRYRLAQIAELTRRDLTRTDDRFELWFALKTRSHP